jgi:hypothetical protein
MSLAPAQTTYSAFRQARQRAAAQARGGAAVGQVEQRHAQGLRHHLDRGRAVAEAALEIGVGLRQAVARAEQRGGQRQQVAVVAEAVAEHDDTAEAFGLRGTAGQQTGQRDGAPLEGQETGHRRAPATRGNAPG